MHITQYIDNLAKQHPLIIDLIFTVVLSLATVTVDFFGSLVGAREKFIEIEGKEKLKPELWVLGSDLALCGFTIGSSSLGLCLKKILTGKLIGSTLVSEITICSLVSASALFIFLFCCILISAWEQEWKFSRIFVVNVAGSIPLALCILVFILYSLR